MKDFKQDINRMKSLFRSQMGNVKPILSESTIKKISSNAVITDWLSPDERYVIFLDELYDLKNKKNLGDVWENTTNLVIFLEHTFRVSKLNSTIKEHAAKVLDKVLLNENTVNLTTYKKQIKEYFRLDEGWGDKIWDAGKKWAKGAVERTKKGLYDFGKDVASGSKEFADAVLAGDMDEIIKLAKKGTLYLARKIRQAVYSEAGLIIDTILVVSGIGKVAQFVVWAIVVALDIYEFTTGDYEHKDDPMWLRIIFFIIDVIGLVFAGMAAKAARSAARAATVGVKTTEELALAVSKSSALKTTLEKGVEALGKAGGKMNEASLKLGAGKIGTWFKSILGKMGSVFKKIGEFIAKLFAWKTIKATAKTAALVGGIGTGVELYKDYKSSNQEVSKNDEDELIKSMETQDADFSDIFKGI